MSGKSTGAMQLDQAGLEDLAGGFASSVRRGDRFYLVGDLGTGKSTFARAFLRALGVTGPVPSPSFIMDAVYEAGGMEIHHVDLYRLKGNDVELVMLGLEEVLETADMVLVEWADRLDHRHDSGGILIRFTMTDDPGLREVSVEDRRVAGH